MARAAFTCYSARSTDTAPSARWVGMRHKTSRDLHVSGLLQGACRGAAIDDEFAIRRFQYQQRGQAVQRQRRYHNCSLLIVSRPQHQITASLWNCAGVNAVDKNSLLRHSSGLIRPKPDLKHVSILMFLRGPLLQQGKASICGVSSTIRLTTVHPTSH